MPMPRKPDPKKACVRCGVVLVRKRFGRRLEDRTRFLTRVSCGQSCGNSREAIGLAGYRARAMRFRGDRCEACGGREHLNAHHIDGDVTNNVAANIQTLCSSCHQTHHWRSRRRGELSAGRLNAVVPQQGAAAFASLLEMAEVQT